jgi:hypothetical protein
MASKYWLKLYHEMLDDPKVARLNDSIYRRFIECMLLAGELDEGGLLPPLEDMAWRLRLSETALSQDMTRLSLAGLAQLVKHEEGDADGNRWYLTKFAERQAPVPADERKRQQREREKKAKYYASHSDVTKGVTNNVTNRDTDTDTDKDTDKIKKKKPTPTPITIPESLNTPQFASAWVDFTEHRKEIKAKMTPRAANMQLKKLSGYSPNTAIAMIEQSIANGWKGIFELKQSTNNHNRQPQAQVSHVAGSI